MHTIFKSIAVSIALISAAQAADREEGMEKWIAATTPVAQHQLLASLVGTWAVHQKDFDVPGKPWNEADGTAVFASVLGGRFLQQDVHTALLRRPFNGINTLGYDREQGKFVGTWMDNFGTSIMPMKGELDTSGKVLTMVGSGGWSLKEIWLDSHHHRMEWWGPGANGSSMLKVEMEYVRLDRAAASAPLAPSASDHSDHS